jgi:hypothetical protein
MKQTESHAVKIVVEAARRLPYSCLFKKADAFGLFFCVAPRRKTLSNWTFIQHNLFCVVIADAGGVVDISIMMSAVLRWPQGCWLAGWQPKRTPTGSVPISSKNDENWISRQVPPGNNSHRKPTGVTVRTA